MKIENLIELTGALPYFDLQTVAQLSGESRHTLRVQLYRWTKLGKVVSLRRGMYAVGVPYRRHPIGAAALANGLYAPSYLSFHWALGFQGLIPERVVLYTSATTRSPRHFENEFGSFRYTHLKRDFFFGYEAAEIDRQRIQVATPEKALLDLWHTESGEWTQERMAGMRFQGLDRISVERLTQYAERFGSPRLTRAVRNWRAYAEAETEGVRML